MAIAADSLHHTQWASLLQPSSRELFKNCKNFCSLVLEFLGNVWFCFLCVCPWVCVSKGMQMWVFAWVNYCRILPACGYSSPGRQDTYIFTYFFLILLLSQKCWPSILAKTGFDWSFPWYKFAAWLDDSESKSSFWLGLATTVWSQTPYRDGWRKWLHQVFFCSVLQSLACPCHGISIQTVIINAFTQ